MIVVAVLRTSGGSEGGSGEGAEVCASGDLDSRSEV
jgi:hypothetical protein